MVLKRVPRDESWPADSTINAQVIREISWMRFLFCHSLQMTIAIDTEHCGQQTFFLSIRHMLTFRRGPREFMLIRRV